MKHHFLIPVALLASTVSGAAIAQAAGDACQAAWKQSSASQSCTSVMQTLPDGSCGGKTQCLPKNYPSYPSGLSVEAAKKLVNCDGELRFDEADCPSTSKHSTHTYDEVKLDPALSPNFGSHHAACTAAWDASSAKKTCITMEFIARSGESNCTIHAQCSYGPGYVERDAHNIVSTGPGTYALATPPPRRSTVTVSESDTKKLSNCDGYLKVGACN
ncbi:hypothetical protein IEQ11_24610 [Lysobacter capsici]|uniref:hypothetical protein n=1 Tax=Lysobacter capsici TaxID=435897 RepID=UPI00177B607D|nr:hypothetical protein [Lysobacter capsici]UOF14853.1 hypothetical protein IEQ11_24610 [Lysobacter capsici]